VPGADGGLFVTDEALSWSAHDGGKPGRTGAPTYVLHATAAWSLVHFDREPAANAVALVAAFARVLRTELPPVVHAEGHRWRYALASGDGVPGGCVTDGATGLLLAGDSLVGGRVEGAFGSGVAAARALLTR
jgi:renalase